MKNSVILKKSLFGFVFIIAVVIGMLSFRTVVVEPANVGSALFSAKRAATHISAISQYPHPMGSAENMQVRDYIVSELSKLGIKAEVQTTRVPEYYSGLSNEFVNIYNIWALIPGTTSTGSIALVGHYDTVPTSPGANDDGSAVATLLETARTLSSSDPLNNDVLILFTDAEEPGQYRYGARYFVDNYKYIDDIKLVLNFEALGRSGPSVMFETTPGNDWLIEGLGKASSNPLAFSFMSELYRLVAKGGTDLIAFEEHGIPGMDFAYPFERTIYHTALDNIENVDERSLQHHGDYAVNITRYFGERNLNEITSANHTNYVFHSFFGNILVYYSESLVIPLVIILGVFLGAVLFLGVWRKKLTLGGVFLSSLIFIGEMLVIVVVATLAWWGIDEAHLALGTVIEPKVKAHLFFIAFLIFSFVAMVLFKRLTSKRINDFNSSIGPIFFWWIVALLFGLYMPGFSIIMVWPILLAVAPQVIMLFAKSGTTSWKFLLICSISVIIIGGIVVAPTYLLFEAMGISSPGFSGSPSFPIVGLSMIFWVFLVSLILPVTRILGDISNKRVIYSVLSIALILLIVGSLLPGIRLESLWIY